MAPDGPKKEQFNALTGLRGFAALWVVSLHFEDVTNLLAPASVALNWLMGAGANAVPLFFVLSGFVLLHTYHQRFNVFSWAEYRRYLGLRVARIYPAYLAALLLMVGLVGLAALRGAPHSEASYPVRWLPWEVLMMHQWWQSDFFGWNFPDWSVSAEWFAYLFIFPLAIWLMKKLPGGIPAILCILVFLLAEPALRLRWNWKVPMVSLLFLTGAGLWKIRYSWSRAGGLIDKHLDMIGVVMLLFALAIGTVLPQYVFLILILFSVSLLILGVTYRGGIPAYALSSRPIIFLGEISYSIYLIHGVVLRLLKIILPAARFEHAPLFLRLAVVFGNFAAVILAAILLYYFVENPARRWLRRRFDLSQTQK
jgi:peptidoglycan/LPS O-acetylase OafA/YrhL